MNKKMLNLLTAYSAFTGSCMNSVYHRFKRFDGEIERTLDYQRLWNLEEKIKLMHEFNDTIINDLCNSLLGEKLGSGSSRDVYVLSYDTSKVVKIAKDGGRQNILEYETWCSVQYSDYHSKWFAPCVWISNGGNILIQERAVPIIPPKLDKDYKVMIDKIPDKIPNYFTDIKLTNFGFIDGRFCCIDYALNNMKECGMTKRMIKNELLDLYKEQ